ncbi:MAG: paraquat-inducible protein A [Gammaproteobacteria bacterium]
MSASRLIACHDCDLLQRIPLQPGIRHTSKCSRCSALLHRGIPHSIERTLALVIAGLILFIVANAFPFLDFRMQGLESRVILLSGIGHLYAEGMWEIATLVLVTTVLVPFLQLATLLYVLGPLYLNRTPWKLGAAFRFSGGMKPWSMMEVFLIGILVALVKLLGMATIIPGPSLWSFALLIVVLAAAMANLDEQLVWERVRYSR